MAKNRADRELRMKRDKEFEKYYEELKLHKKGDKKGNSESSPKKPKIARKKETRNYYDAIEFSGLKS